MIFNWILYKNPNEKRNINQIFASTAALATVVSVLIFIISKYNEQSDLIVKINLQYEGYVINIQNNGNLTSQDNYVRIESARFRSWRDYEAYQQIRDLPPKTDFSINVHFLDEAIKHGHTKDRNLVEYGYIVVSSANMKKPKAFAFIICYQTTNQEECFACNKNINKDGDVYLYEFNYPDKKPFYNCYIGCDQKGLVHLFDYKEEDYYRCY